MTQELTFFLTPQSWEPSARSIVIHLGAELAKLRLVRRQTIAEVSCQLGITQSVIEGIERGDVQRRGASFANYLAYAEYLNVAVLQLIGSVVASENASREVSPCVVRPAASSTVREEIGETLLKIVRQAVQRLEVLESAVTQEVIGKAVGMTPQGLKKYPAVSEFLREYTATQKARRRIDRAEQEAQLLQQAYEIASQLQAQGHPVSGRAVARKLNVPWSSLRAYPSIHTWLQNLSGSADGSTILPH